MFTIKLTNVKKKRIFFPLKKKPTVTPLQLALFDDAECSVFWTDQHQIDQDPKPIMDNQMGVLVAHLNSCLIPAKYAKMVNLNDLHSEIRLK